MDSNFSGFIAVILWIIGTVGWYMNIVHLINDPFINGMSIAKGIGFFVLPLGAILGFIN